MWLLIWKCSFNIVKEGARPHPQHHHPVPQGHPFSTMCWLVTESPPEVHKLSQIQNAHSITMVPPHHPHNNSPHFLCGQSNNTAQPYPLCTFIAFPLALLSAQSHWCSLLPWPPPPSTGQRSHRMGDMATYHHVPDVGPTSEA